MNFAKDNTQLTIVYLDFDQNNNTNYFVKDKSINCIKVICLVVGTE